MSKIKIQEVIVVEGKDDTANLRRFYEVDTYETRGSAINEDDLERINKLNDLRGVIVFTDPDYNGERIRKIIMEAVPTAKHAFLNRGEATQNLRLKVVHWVLSMRVLRTFKRPYLEFQVVTMMIISLIFVNQIS